jgi:Ala-tRNA(Pro) deacylase
VPLRLVLSFLDKALTDTRGDGSAGKVFHGTRCIRIRNFRNPTIMDIYQFLKDNDIDYQRHDHPPVYTCREADRLVPGLPAAKIKNLFLCDNQGRRHFLLVIEAEKSVDLKALCSILHINKPRFASLQRMRKYLRAEPGSATLLALINDPGRRIEVVMNKTQNTYHRCAVQG